MIGPDIRRDLALKVLDRIIEKVVEVRAREALELKTRMRPGQFALWQINCDEEVALLEAERARIAEQPPATIIAIGENAFVSREVLR